MKAQIDTLKELNGAIDTEFKEYEIKVKKTHYDLVKEGQIAEKTRLDLDKEIGGATNEKVKVSDEHF